MFAVSYMIFDVLGIHVTSLKLMYNITFFVKQVLAVSVELNGFLMQLVPKCYGYRIAIIQKYTC